MFVQHRDLEETAFTQTHVQLYTIYIVHSCSLNSKILVVIIEYNYMEQEAYLYTHCNPHYSYLCMPVSQHVVDLYIL